MFPPENVWPLRRSKNVYGQVDPSYGKIKEYAELEGEELPGSGLSARQMARIINFLKKNGNYSLSNTQDMGNCQYAAVQRGTQLKREVTSMHLRRFMIMKMCKHPPILQQIPVQESGHPLWPRQDACKGASTEGEGRYHLCPRCCLTRGSLVHSPSIPTCCTSILTGPGEMSTLSPSCPASGRLASLCSSQISLMSTG